MSITLGGRAFKIEAPEARSFQMLGGLWRVLASGDETGGVVGALDERLTHGIRAPMHTHDEADELFYVLDGNLTFFIGEQRIEAAPGAFVYLPRFVQHGFQVNTPEARVFNFVTPSGFERLMLEVGTPGRYDDAPTPDDPHSHGNLPSAAVLKKYGMRLIPPVSK